MELAIYIEQVQEGLLTILYFPKKAGKRVRPGGNRQLLYLDSARPSPHFLPHFFFTVAHQYPETGCWGSKPCRHEVWVVCSGDMIEINS